MVSNEVFDIETLMLDTHSSVTSFVSLNFKSACGRVVHTTEAVWESFGFIRFLGNVSA